MAAPSQLRDLAMAAPSQLRDLAMAAGSDDDLASSAQEDSLLRRRSRPEQKTRWRYGAYALAGVGACLALLACSGGRRIFVHGHGGFLNQALSYRPSSGEWELCLNQYCGSDHKIGDTQEGIGPEACEQKCSSTVGCVAFEMYYGGSDCTMRPRCPNPAPSSVSTYVVVKTPLTCHGQRDHDCLECGDQATIHLPVELDSTTPLPPVPTPSPSPTPTPTWSPTPSPTPAPTPSPSGPSGGGAASAPSAGCGKAVPVDCSSLQSLNPAPGFDCGAGVTNWRSGWSELKKQWCCCQSPNHSPTNPAPGCPEPVAAQAQCDCLFGKPATGGNCTGEAEYFCASCLPGYHLTADHHCQPNTCACDNGLAAVGEGCAQDGDKVCVNCMVGWHLNHSWDGGTGACVPNKCQCVDGVAAEGRACEMDGANICKDCGSGYVLSATTYVCEEAVCTCQNGVPMTGMGCDGTEKCVTCDAQYRLEGQRCRHNTCHCDHGVAALDGLCTEHGAHICATCDHDFFLHQGLCGGMKCLCENGQAVSDEQCTTNGGNICLTCNVGYTLLRGQCVLQGCTCEHGTAAHGEECAKAPHSAAAPQVCAGCNPGFNLVDTKCEANLCTCAYGAPALDALCEFPTEHCQTCNTGYHHQLGSQDGHVIVTCVENLCFCMNGKPAVGPACHTEGENICGVCHPGFFLDTSGACQPIVCECPNGKPRMSSACEKDGAVDCLSCNEDYHLASEPKNVHGSKHCRHNSETTKPVFDCHIGWNTWELSWSEAKRYWCCENEKVGCIRQASGTALCEGKRFTRSQCMLVGCCAYNPTDQECESAIGGAICAPAPYIRMLEETDDRCFTATAMNQVGQPISVESCNTADRSQQWRRYSDSSDLRIESYFGLCLTKSGFDSIVIAACEGSTEQRWVWDPATHKLETLGNDPVCLTAPAAHNLVQQLKTATCSDSDPLQKFVISAAAEEDTAASVNNTVPAAYTVPAAAGPSLAGCVQCATSSGDAVTTWTEPAVATLTEPAVATRTDPAAVGKNTDSVNIMMTDPVIIGR